MKKIRKTTISKGYRLKPETHQLVKKMQKQINCSQDAVISEALKYYHSKINIVSNK